MSLQEALQMREQVHAEAAQRSAQRNRPPATASQLDRGAVNRRNAQHSTGPVTDAGKAVSCLNAVKTGLTGRTVLLHASESARYARHLREYQDEYRPATLRERELVQSLADTQWRLARIPALEMALLASVPTACDGFVESDAPVGCLVELESYLKHEKQLRNLHLQENRLLRRYDKERKELLDLQAARKTQESAAAPPPPEQQSAALTTPRSGFEFSKSHEQQSQAAPASHPRVAPSPLITPGAYGEQSAQTSSQPHPTCDRF